MSRILSPNQSALENHFVETLHLFDAKIENVEQSSQTGINAAQGTANTALANAANAQGTANTAVTNAANAQGTANNALAKGQSAEDALVGSTNFFKGNTATSINGTPFGLVLSAFNNVTSEGISITGGGYFNFSYLGDYLCSVSLEGDMANSRTDWYQLLMVTLYNAATGETIYTYNKTIPPSMTLGIQGACPPVLVKVVQGDQWKVRIYVSENGVISNGSAVVRWSKVV